MSSSPILSFEMWDFHSLLKDGSWYRVCKLFNSVHKTLLNLRIPFKKFLSLLQVDISSINFCLERPRRHSSRWIFLRSIFSTILPPLMRQVYFMPRLFSYFHRDVSSSSSHSLLSFHQLIIIFTLSKFMHVLWVDPYSRVRERKHSSTPDQSNYFASV